MHYQSIVRRIVVWLVSILFAFRLRPVWRVWWAAVSVGAVGAVGAVAEVEIAFGDVFSIVTCYFASPEHTHRN